MPTVAEIQQAILVLPEADCVRLRQWISDLDWERWDRRLEADSEPGTLDFLVDEARDAAPTTSRTGSLHGELPAHASR